MVDADNVEIERKFLVESEFALSLSEGQNVVQGYLASADSSSIRVRIIPSQQRATLAVKGPSYGPVRREVEEELGILLAQLLLSACGSRVVEKTRHNVIGDDGKLWVVDVFIGPNSGLYLAEIELGSPGELFATPVWSRGEVTDDKRYYNEHLADHPYSTWET